MAVGDGCQSGLEIGEGLYAVDLAGFDQRSDAAPGDAAFIVTGEERIFAIEDDRADQVFDPVGGLCCTNWLRARVSLSPDRLIP